MREEAVLVEMKHRHVVQEIVFPEGAVGTIIGTDRARQWHVSAQRASAIRSLLE